MIGNLFGWYISAKTWLSNFDQLRNVLSLAELLGEFSLEEVISH